MKIASPYATLYTEEEIRILRLTYSLYFTRTGSEARDIANALKGKCHDEAGILKAYYPYQTPEGRPLKRVRDKSSNKQVWKLIKITDPMALQILTKCIYAFIDHKYGDEPEIEIHNEGDVVQDPGKTQTSAAQPEQLQVPLTMTDENVKSILEQIAVGKMNRRQVYHCCGDSFDTLYEFRKHLFLKHPEEMKLFFEDALTGGNLVKPTAEEVHKMARRGRNTKEKALKKAEERRVRKHNQDAYPTPAKGDYFRLIYTPMGNKK